MEITFDLFEQLEDLYRVKARHLHHLNSLLPDAWQALIPRGYGDIWEQEGWKFRLKDTKPLPRPIRLLIPDRRQLAVWTLMGFANELIMEVSPESLGDFLEKYIDNPAARRNLAEMFMGEDMVGPGLKAFGSIVVCAREENRFLDLYLPTLRAFAAHDPRRTAVDEELASTATALFKEIEDFKRYLDSDVYLYRRFAKDLKALFRSGASVGVLGYGEVNPVLSFSGEGRERTAQPPAPAFKRMPPFPGRESVESYQALFERYHELLNEIGLNPPRHGIRQISRGDGTFTVFVTQGKLPPESIGSRVIRVVSEDDCRRLFRMVLLEMLKAARHNRENPELMVGLDIHISNWGIEGYDPSEPKVTGDEKLFYIDTSTPMVREGGREMLDPALYLASVPFFLRPLSRLRLRSVLGRYYDPRKLALDLAADFLREGREDVLGALVEEGNRFFESEMSDWGPRPLRPSEVKRRHRRSLLSSRLLHASRRIDRFVQQKLLRRSYPYRIPGE